MQTALDYTSNQSPSKFLQTSTLTNESLKLEVASHPRDWENIVEGLLNYFPRCIPITQYYKTDKRKTPAGAGWRKHTPRSLRYWGQGSIVRQDADGNEYEFYCSGYYNIGIPVEAGWVVLDLDRKNGKDGLRFLINFCNANGIPLPLTFVVNTPSGGRHLYFKTNKTWTNAADILGKDSGIDMRSVGSWVMAPGSRVEKITQDGEIETVFYSVGKALDIVQMPEELEAALDNWFANSKAKPVQHRSMVPVRPEDLPEVSVRIADARKSVETYCPISTKMNGDGGNKKIYRTACVLVEHGLDLEQALPIFKEWNDRCTPSWEEIDCIKTFQSALQNNSTSVGSAYAKEVIEDSLFELELVDSQQKGAFSFKTGSAAEIAKHWVAQRNEKHVVSDGAFFYIYDPKTGVWNQEDEAQFKQTLYIYEDMLTEKKMNIEMNADKATLVYRTIVQRTFRPDFFDNAKTGRATLSGFFCIEDGIKKILPHSPDHAARHLSEYEVNLDMDAPRTRKMLRDMFQDPNEERAFLEYTGVAIFGNIGSTKTMAQIHGEPNSGKSTLLRTIEQLWPVEAICSTDPQDWYVRFGLEGMYGKAVVICHDVPDAPIYGSQIKKLAESEAVDVEFKNKSRFRHKFKLAIYLATNEPLNIAASRDAVYNRLLHFQTKRTLKMNGVEGDIEAVMDYHETLKGERGGLLNAIADAYIEFTKRGDFGDVSFSAKHKSAHRKLSPHEVLPRFIDDRVEFDPSYIQPVFDAFTEFHVWVDDNHEKYDKHMTSWSAEMVGAMRKRGVTHDKAYVSGQQVRVFKGMRVLASNESRKIKDTGDTYVEILQHSTHKTHKV